ncbi:MAG: hypothetical protein KIT25_19295 [Enhydrobacter sp.]|nr:MAG: hypothetical protein KIT25_19295 [Enhydrobacter sp.]
MNASRVSLSAALGLALLVQAAQSAWAQASPLDERPSGFLTARTGGLPADAWTGTALATAKRLVSALPAAPRSRALRDLQFRVMVSELAPPIADGSAGPSLFARKVDRLAAMGEGESLNETVRSADAYSDPDIAAIVVDALLMARERAGACSIVSRHALAQPFGRRADIACKLIDGDNAGALAAIAPLRGSDAGFATLVRVAAGGLPPTAAPPGPLDGPAMVMLDLAHVAPPPSVLGTTQPAMIRALVGHRMLPLPMRIEIAERGEALAVIEATRLSDLYLQAIGDGVALPPATARRARLVAAARNATTPQEIVSAIAAVYGETRNSPLFATVARASASALLSLPAKAEYANVAQEAMRGLLLLGDKRLAEAWTKLALNAAYNNARAMIALDRLMPLVVVAGIDNPQRLDADDVNRWYEVIRQDDARTAPLNGNLLLQLFRATGNDLAPRATQLPEVPPGNVRLVMPPAATLRALQIAGAARRRAEAALLAAAAAGETPLAQLHPTAVGIIVRSLREAGEDHAARLFAIETAIAHGL